METSKKAKQTPKSKQKLTDTVISTLKTLWAVGASVVATGVLQI